ncbi:General alpha-glucoside permease [Drechslerella dactyloides]|uniref:General alpha-glucoside permease n=1 Tax=Drechslerella dactyloides TaxID=74499 RepID=A0AAD6J255_DREDA|nr:General alpha-glucoside permease [Drechslerella dactyloides]
MDAIGPNAALAVDDEKLDSHSHKQIVTDARAAADKEHRMTLLQGVRLYPKAIAWSILISTCIAMEGYDLCLLGNFYAFPQFNREFGHDDGNGNFQVSAPWQAGLSNAANVGEFIGLIINGIVSERFGYKRTVLVCLAIMAGLIAIPVTATSVQALLVYYILAGIPWGIWQTLTISYAAEVCPVALRGYLTTYVNFCWGLGQVIGVGVIKSQLHRESVWAYKLPWALQWMWIPPLFIGICFAPESPWLLVRKGRLEEAKHNLLRLTSLNKETDFDADETVSMMVHTTQLERQTTAGASYFDCFRGINLRRTEITCMIWAIQNLSGNSFTGYSTYFFQQAGIATEDAFSFTIGQYGINMIGVFGAWALMSWGIGRRSLYLYGLCGLFTMLLVIGCLNFVPASGANAAAYATGGLMLGWATTYQLTVGTICYSLVGEIPSRRLLIKTVALGRCAYIIVGIICSVLTPYMINPTAWNWQKLTAFFWAGICFFSILYTYFRVPEPSGRSFAELDLLFEKRVSARAFAKTDLDVYATEESERAAHAAEKNTAEFEKA